MANPDLNFELIRLVRTSPQPTKREVDTRKNLFEQARMLILNHTQSAQIIMRALPSISVSAEETNGYKPSTVILSAGYVDKTVVVTFADSCKANTLTSAKLFNANAWYGAKIITSRIAAAELSIAGRLSPRISKDLSQLSHAFDETPGEITAVSAEAYTRVISRAKHDEELLKQDPNEPIKGLFLIDKIIQDLETGDSFGIKAFQVLGAQLAREVYINIYPDAKKYLEAKKN